MTFDWIRLLRIAHAEFAARIAAVTDWDAPTPDTDWTTRDLVAHVIEDQQEVPQLLAGRTHAEAQLAIVPLGDDLASEWRVHAPAALAAWTGVDPSQPVSLSYDTVPAADYLAELVSDIAIHTWDLARATGTSEALDDDLVDAVWTVFEPQADALAASGLFAPAVPVPADAPLHVRLLALTGRDAS